MDTGPTDKSRRDGEHEKLASLIAEAKANIAAGADVRYWRRKLAECEEVARMQAESDADHIQGSVLRTPAVRRRKAKLKSGLGAGQWTEAEPPRAEAALPLADRLVKAVRTGRGLVPLRLDVERSDAAELGPAEGAKALLDWLRSDIADRIMLSDAVARKLGVTPNVTEPPDDPVTQNVTQRLCVCGCGQPAEVRVTKYAKGSAHRVRAHRAQTGRRADP